MRYNKILLILSLMIGCLSATAMTADTVRKAKKGIIVVEYDSTARAMEPYSFNRTALDYYAQVVNHYQETFPEVSVYAMVVPNAVAFYCPDSVVTWSSDEHAAIKYLNRQLDKNVYGIDLCPVLQPHADEPIYARTDHHWMPLGAYYAAQEFALVAKVPFLDLSEYDEHVIRNFVGTMYRFSGDRAIQAHPEDFVYYTPRDVKYEASHVRYSYHSRRVGKKRHRRTVTTLVAHPSERCDFFRPFPDGSAAAYSTFMGGDLNTTSVKTDTENGRRLLILKDSYGNALPAFLFGSFQEIHVVDCRYFTQNIISFVIEHDITDILFANNLIHASSPVTSQSYKKYLTQHR